MRFTEQHEWLQDEDGVVTVGITEYAAEALGDVVFVELPEIGQNVVSGEEIAVIESVKAASGIEAPCDGEIAEINENTVENPSIVNEDPLGNAWFFKIKPISADDLDELMDEDAYMAFIEDNGH